MKKVLFIGSDVGRIEGAGIDRIYADTEARFLLEIYTRTEAVAFIYQPAVIARDLPGLLESHNAHVVHIACHGVKGALLFKGSHDNDEDINYVSSETLAKSLSLSPRTEIVYIDACQSKDMAVYLQEQDYLNLKCTIGHDIDIGSKTAYEGAAAFHRSLSGGASVAAAFTALSATVSATNGTCRTDIFKSKKPDLANLNLANVRLVPDPVKIIARFASMNRVQRNEKGAYEIELGLYNLPDEFWTVCFFTTHDNLIAKDEHTIVKDQPSGPFFWTHDYGNDKNSEIWEVESNIELFACYVQGEVTKVVRSKLRDALYYYYESEIVEHDSALRNKVRVVLDEM